MQAVTLGIKTKKVVSRGEKFYKILAFSCYEQIQLPCKYFEEFPYCSQVDNILVVVTGNKPEDSYVFKVGDLVPEKDFQKALKIIKHCGEKLHVINEEIKQIKKDWKGIEDFEI